MRNELKKGYRLNFSDNNKNFIIKDVLGRGASCLVYLAETNENNNVRYSIIKEFNPAKLDLPRDNFGALLIPDEQKQQYSILLERFKAGYEKQQKIRLINDMTNVTSNIQGIYCANNTQYIEMTYFNGETYLLKDEKNLYDFFRRMKALTQVVENYHNAGFLHLDIKPDNIFVLPETPEMVMLFDFDSVIEKGAVVGSAPLSYTKDWAAIEQIDLKRREEICEATDLFAIGEMVFYYFFGRHSDISDRRSFTKYSFDYNSNLFDGVNPLIISHLNELLHKTICNIVKNRYQTAKELTEKLDIIISLSNPNIPFLKTNIPTATGFFVGRDDEIELLHNKIQNTDILFVSGIGGIGKSELVKHYAGKYINAYDAIIFAPFVSDVFTLITDDISIPVCNFKQFPEEKAEEYYARKLRKLKELCNDKVLIIIDNFDNEEELDKLLGMNCKILFTTRCDFSDVYEQVELNALKNRNHITEIFNNFYAKPLSAEDKEIVEEIIDIVEGHTMTVELLAKQMMAGRVNPKQMLEKLNHGGVANSGKEKIRISKDEHISSGNAYSHIQTLFDLSELNENEVYILANLSLIPHTGISTELFCQWCEIDNYDTINSLVDEGWIRIDKENDCISIHSLVNGLIENEFEVEVLCKKLLKNMTQSIDYFRGESVSNQKILTRIFMYSIDYVYKNNFCNEETAIFLRKVSLKLRSIYFRRDVEDDLEYRPQLGVLELFNYGQRSIDICLKVFGKMHIATYRAYQSASLLYKIAMKHNEAKRTCLEGLKISKELYGVQSEQFLLLLVNFGKLFIFEKKYNVAEKIYEYVKSFSKKDNSNLVQVHLKSLLYMGHLYVIMKEEQKSIEVLKQYIELADKNNIEVSISAFRLLCVNYRKIGSFDKSIMYGEKAVELIQNNGRGNLPKIYSSLGYSYLQFGKYEKAEELLSKALSLRINIYGKEHFKTVLSYSRLGSLYEEISDYKTAANLYKAAAEIQKKLLGDKAPETIESYKKVDECYAKCAEKGEKQFFK